MRTKPPLLTPRGLFYSAPIKSEWIYSVPKERVKTKGVESKRDYFQSGFDFEDHYDFATEIWIRKCRF